MKQQDEQRDSASAQAAAKRPYEAPKVLETACFERTVLAAHCAFADEITCGDLGGAFSAH